MNKREQRLREAIRKEISSLIREDDDDVKKALTGLVSWSNYNVAKAKEAGQLVRQIQQGSSENTLSATLADEWHNMVVATAKFQVAVQRIAKRMGVTKEGLKEMTGTGAVAPFQTPFAFQGSSSQNKAKRRKSAETAGYKAVVGKDDEEKSSMKYK